MATQKSNGNFSFPSQYDKELNAVSARLDNLLTHGPGGEAVWKRIISCWKLPTLTYTNMQTLC